MSLPEPDQTIDLTGLKCPLPVLRTKKALAALAAGRVLRVIASDPGALDDIPAFARMSGHELLIAERTDAGSVFLLRR
ncbi:MAG: sulfurtransferase TusA family protein [Betaproteobacteria bacterium]|nr:sulfurtransferase TusA family protein [Betaproteobacteria bacterium]